MPLNNPIAPSSSMYFKSPMDFGADGGGSVDDSSALQDALDAVRDAGGGTCYLPAGKTFLFDTSLKLPHSMTAPFVVSCYGATLKRGGTAEGAFIFDRTADDQVFSNIYIIGATVDHQRFVAHSCGALLSCDDGLGTMQEHINIDGLVVRDYRIYNMVRGDEAGAADKGVTGIRLGHYSTVNARTPASYFANILIENGYQDGGASAISIFGTETVTDQLDCTAWADNITVRKVYHRTNATDLAHQTADGFQFGSTHLCIGKVRMYDCETVGANDLGYEINNVSDFYAENCIARNCSQEGFGVPMNFSWPLYSDRATGRVVQRCVLKNCWAIYDDEGLRVSRSPAAYSYGFSLRNMDGGPALGTLVMEDCGVWYNVPGFGTGQGGRLMDMMLYNTLDGDSRSCDGVIMKNCHYYATGLVTSSSEHPLDLKILALAVSNTVIDIDGLDIVVNWDCAGVSGDCGLEQVYLGALAQHGGKLYVRRVRSDLTVSGASTFGSTSLVQLMSAGPEGLSGFIEKCSYVKNDIPGAADYAVYVGPNAGAYPLVLEHLAVRDNNFSLAKNPNPVYIGAGNKGFVTQVGNVGGTPPAAGSLTLPINQTISGAGSISLASPTVITLAAHLLIDGDVIWVSAADSSPAPSGFYAVSYLDSDTFNIGNPTTGVLFNVTASAGANGTFRKAYCNRDWYDEDIVINGGTGTLIQVCTDDGASWTTVLSQSSGAFPYTTVRLGTGDFLYVASTGAPSAWKIPRV